MRHLAAFLLGVLAGVALVMPVASRRVEQLEIERQELARALDETRLKLGNLQDTVSRWQARPVVRAVAVRVANVGDRSLKLKLEGQLKPLVDNLVGREVGRLDAAALESVFAGRKVRVGEKEYIPDLKRAFIGEEVEFVLEVHEAPSRPTAAGAGTESAGGEVAAGVSRARPRPQPHLDGWE